MINSPHWIQKASSLHLSKLAVKICSSLPLHSMTLSYFTQLSVMPEGFLDMTQYNLTLKWSHETIHICKNYKNEEYDCQSWMAFELSFFVHLISDTGYSPVVQKLPLGYFPLPKRGLSLTCRAKHRSTDTPNFSSLQWVASRVPSTQESTTQ